MYRPITNGMASLCKCTSYEKLYFPFCRISGTSWYQRERYVDGMPHRLTPGFFRVIELSSADIAMSIIYLVLNIMFYEGSSYGLSYLHRSTAAMMAKPCHARMAKPCVRANDGTKTASSYTPFHPQERAGGRWRARVLRRPIALRSCRTRRGACAETSRIMPI